MTEQTYIVDIDVDQLRQHRSRLEHRDISPDDARSWLVNGGFYPRPDGLYVAEEAVLRQLEPTEIIAARAVGAMLH